MNVENVIFVVDPRIFDIHYFSFFISLIDRISFKCHLLMESIYLEFVPNLIAVRCHSNPTTLINVSDFQFTNQEYLTASAE